MAKNHHYNLWYSRTLWLVSLALFVIILGTMICAWPRTMQNGEPGISSAMLAADRERISWDFCTHVIGGYIFLGVIAVIGYMGYWYCHYIPFLPPKLNETAEKYHHFCMSGYIAIASWFVQRTFTIGDSWKTLYHWGLSGFALINAIVASISLILALKSRKIDIEKLENDMKNSADRIRVRGSIFRDFSLLIHAVVNVVPVIVAVTEVCKLFFTLPSVPLPTKYLLVAEPFVMNTPYDFCMALTAPLVLGALLKINLCLNAPPKIGVPYRYASKGIKIFTLAERQKES